LRLSRDHIDKGQLPEKLGILVQNIGQMPKYREALQTN
jgi:hypothetical protein